jgi:hypothetical protein
MTAVMQSIDLIIMKIFELYNPNIKREDFDLSDDLIFFMRNDPGFFRQEYHPFLNKFNRHCDAGRKVSTKAFIPIVKQAFDHYKNSFPVEGLEEQLSERDLEEICEKLLSEETTFYHEEKKKSTEKER